MPYIFNNNYIEAFKKLKNWLISSLILYYYNVDLELMLKTDAFNGVIAEILLQLYLDSKWYPITFFLKNNRPSQV